MPKILIAFDESAGSLNAVRQVVDGAREMTGIEAVLLNVQHAAPIPERLFKAGPAARRAMEAPLLERGMRCLDQAGEMLREAGIPFTPRVEIGEPAPVIAACAKKLRCDLIVMGTHGLSAVGKLLLGSVALRVLHLSRVPVMLAK